MLLAGILGYIVLQLGIGLFVSRRTASEADYLLAGRRLPFGVTMMTIFATWFGAETCIGSSGEVYADGLSGGRADPFGYALCILCMGLVFAVPLWRRGLMTVGDLFRQRYTPGVERFVVLLVVPTSVMWAAAQIRAFGQVLSASSSLNVEIAIAVAALVVVVYTTAGGMLADAVTDVLQGAVLIGGLILLLGIVVFGGQPLDLSPALATDRLQILGGAEEPFLGRIETWAIPILGSVVAQELVSRTLAARSAPVARNAALAASGLYLLIGLIPLTLGLLGPALVPGLEDHEQFLPTLAQHLLHPVLYVLFAGALISAILSTVDSALLAAASLTSHNLVLPLMGAVDERTKVRLARAAVVGFGLVAFVMAQYASGVYALVEEASAFGSAGVFVVAAFALFTRLGGAPSAYAALAAGVVVYIAGEHVLRLPYPYLLSLASALAVYVGGGLVERALARTDALPATE